MEKNRFDNIMKAFHSDLTIAELEKKLATSKKTIINIWKNNYSEAERKERSKKSNSKAKTGKNNPMYNKKRELSPVFGRKAGQEEKTRHRCFCGPISGPPGQDREEACRLPRDRPQTCRRHRPGSPGR